ncbi:MAG: hypothetical protein WD208_10100 [Dehalococcoidia bacterium]
MTAKVWPRACRSCAGDLILSPQAESDDLELKCLQCGRTAYEITADAVKAAAA